MSGMINYLATYFGSTKEAAAASPQQQQDALIELFTKEAEVAGYDLEKMSQQQIRALYDQFLKLAEEAGDSEHKEDDDEEKKRKAEAELEEKKASAEKRAEAAEMGRIMARSYVDELQKIAAEAEKEASAADTAKGLLQRGKSLASEGLNKVKANLPTREGVSNAINRYGEGLTGSKSQGLHAAADKSIATARKADAIGNNAQTEFGRQYAKHVKEKHQGLAAQALSAAKAEDKHVRNTRIGTGVAAGALLAGGAAAHHNKSASAIDESAFERAIEKAAEAGWDPEEAVDRIRACYTLGLLGESEKIANAAASLTVDGAIDIRALEFLESAGYPVTWNE